MLRQLRLWVLELLGGSESDYVLLQSLVDRNDVLERRHKAMVTALSLADGLLSAKEYDMAQSQIRATLISHRDLR